MCIRDRYHGAVQKENENRTLRFGLRLCIYTACGFMFILLISPSAVMSVFVKNQNLISLGNTYNRIVLFSFIPYAVAQMLGVGYRVIAHTRIPMYAGTLSFVLNVVLNYGLIFGRLGLPAMGIAGAASVSYTHLDVYKRQKLDNRVEAFAKRFTDNLVVVDTAEYAIDGLDPEFRFIVSPMILTALVTERRCV